MASLLCVFAYVSTKADLSSIGRSTYFTRMWLFSCVCSHMCHQTWCFCEKEEPHTSQECGFSPVCVRICCHQILILVKRKCDILHKNVASLLCVFAYASLKSDLVYKGKATHFTTMWLLPCVCSHMFHFKVWFYWKWITTHFTRMWLLSCVYLHMLHQIWFLWKGIATYFTRIWLLSSVCSNMLQQIWCC